VSKPGDCRVTRQHNHWTSADLGQSSTPKPDSRFVTVAVIRPTKNERVEFTVPAERGNPRSAALSRPAAVGE